MHGPWSRRALLIGVLLSLVIAVGAFTLGLAHGAHMAQVPAGAFPGHGPHAGPPGGFGWFLFPLAFVALFFILPALCFGGRRGWHGGPGHGVPPAFEEWHRRAHANDPANPGTPPPGTSSGTPA